ncbi:MAG: sulfide/dihydroorotate dehydrogenase-like FAD/NAD-binding protein [Candidatus Coatesbacteria bacterium]|nr:sulfide/dihydroorotate dehydrogenase-like FAD/NAD-binding protein [Candidatus Coatesbacteria bacterium]
MFEIVSTEELGPRIKRFEIKAPLVARKIKPGQFIMLRIDDNGERIPLTMVDHDAEAGTVTIIFEEVGKTTIQLGKLKTGDELLDFIGPLGAYHDMTGGEHGRVIGVGGGIGNAPLLPKVSEFHEQGLEVTGIIGARSKEILILEDEIKAACDTLHICTDDGSHGHHGFVSDVLKQLLDESTDYDFVLAIGPPIMMKVCRDLVKPYGVPCYVSLNTIMVDGTGMCGSCRVSVGDEVKFACVDGPEMRGEEIDFEEMMARQRRYVDEEQCALERYLKEVGE